MSHPFGDLLSQYLHRKHGLSQAKLAAGILQDPAIITKMCKGQRLSGQQARERLVMILGWLQTQQAIETAAEANALLTAAGMAPLRENEPTERLLVGKLQSEPFSTSSPTAHAADMAPHEEDAVASEPRSIAFGRLLQDYRLRAGLTQEALAERAGLSRRAISDLERGERTGPWRDTVQLLIAALNLTGAGRTQLEAAARHARVPASLTIERGSLENPAPPRHNLPVPLTSFVGRTQEVATVSGLLRRPNVRLVTLLGPGGVGKTRLALTVAAELAVDFAQGVVFVALDSIRDAGLVETTIGQAVGVKETANQPIGVTLHHALRDRRQLLVLDNFEQVVDAAPALAALLGHCPQLKLLVTSREVLRLAAEHVYEVAPLTIPTTSAGCSPEQLQQYDAVQLFVERAQAAQASFTLTSANAAALSEICVRLEGLPLAIELAATRIRMFPPRTLLTRLELRLPLLSVDGRDRSPRHQTLRSALAWSYDLLTPNQKALIRQISVFVGGFRLEAAQAVSGHPPDDVLAGLESLVSKSLLQTVEVGGLDWEQELRFTQLDTIREYALEQLTGSGEAPAAQGRHAAYFQALVGQAERAWFGPEQDVWFDLLETERANLRAALGWLHGIGEHEAALRLGIALGRFWFIRGPLSEGTELLQKLLGAPDPAIAPATRAIALESLAILARRQGQYAVASAHFAEALALYRMLGDRRREAHALLSLGNTKFQQEDYALARQLSTEALTLARQADNQRVVSYALEVLGQSALCEGDFATAREILQEALSLAREQGDQLRITLSLRDLGNVAFATGCYAEARSHLTETLTLACSHKDQTAIAHVFLDLASLAAAQGYASRAICLAAAAARRREVFGTLLPPAWNSWSERWLQPARDTLTEDVQVRARAKGQAMTLEQAVTYALEEDGG